MSFTDINIGAIPNDGTGDSLRAGGEIINENFGKAVNRETLTTKGDLLALVNASTIGRVPLGTDGQTLKVSIVTLAVSAVADNGGFCQYTIGTHTFVVGDVLLGDSFGEEYNVVQTVTAFDGTTVTTDLAFIADDTGNLSRANNIIWGDGVDVTTTRGDILYRNAAGEIARLPLGAAGSYLYSDGNDLMYAILTVSDDAYNATSWNANTDAATKNAIRDKIVSMDSTIAVNSSKVSNATHTGEVTGSGYLTIANNVVDEANMKISNSPVNGYVLTADSAVTGGWKWAAGGGGMVYPSAGIALSTGSAWAASITDNSSNWNTAYNDKINSASFNTSTGVITLTQQDAGTITVDIDGRFAATNQTMYIGTTAVAINRSSGTLNLAGIGTLATGDITTTGNITATGEITAYTVSDKRLKTDVENIDNATETINKLRPVIFKWNDTAKELNKVKDDRNNFGLIAQEVEKPISCKAIL